MDSPVRVLIADDEALVRAGFRALIDAAPGFVVVAEAGTGAETVRQARRTRPDVILLDLRMPVLDGLEALRHLARDPEPAKVIVVTTFDDDENVFTALRHGASGFLRKDTPPEQLLDAVRLVAAGEALLAPDVTRRLIAEFARQAPLSVRPVLDGLTEREREVLVQVAGGRSNAEIARVLVVSVPTVKTHVGHLLTKLGVRDRSQLVVVAYEAGLVRPGA